MDDFDYFVAVAARRVGSSMPRAESRRVASEEIRGAQPGTDQRGSWPCVDCFGLLPTATML